MSRTPDVLRDSWRVVHRDSFHRRRPRRAHELSPRDMRCSWNGPNFAWSDESEGCGICRKSPGRLACSSRIGEADGKPYTESCPRETRSPTELPRGTANIESRPALVVWGEDRGTRDNLLCSLPDASRARHRDSLDTFDLPQPALRAVHGSCCSHGAPGLCSELGPASPRDRMSTRVRSSRKTRAPDGRSRTSHARRRTLRMQTPSASLSRGTPCRTLHPTQVCAPRDNPRRTR